jgi:hypothetical protein
MSLKDKKSYNQKQEEFLKGIKNMRTVYKQRTELKDLPIKFILGSSSHNPEQEVTFETSDFTLWVKFLDKWFQPYGQFDQFQIEKMINICSNDVQIVSLMELLSANNE